jgi:hypothetical protein
MKSDGVASPEAGFGAEAAFVVSMVGKLAPNANKAKAGLVEKLRFLGCPLHWAGSRLL